MDINYNEMTKNMLDQLEKMAKTETVIGEKFELGEFTCIPVIKLGIGFGSGGGSGAAEKQGKGEGGGFGGAIGIEPVAFLAAKGDQISMMNVGKSKGMQSFFDKMPDLVNKIIDKKNND